MNVTVKAKPLETCLRVKIKIKNAIFEAECTSLVVYSGVLT